MGGALVVLAPLPTQLVYVILFIFDIIAVASLVIVPETTAKKSGALRSLVPNVYIPKAARSSMAALMPLSIAGWALGGFYLSLMPALVAAATDSGSPLVGAGVVATLTLAATITVLRSKNTTPTRLLRIGGYTFIVGISMTLTAMHAHSAAGMTASAMIAGVGFGSTYLGGLKALMPLSTPQDRAGLLSAYLVVCYTAFAAPAIAASLLASHIGLVATADVYGAVLLMLASSSLVLSSRAIRKNASCSGLSIDESKTTG